MKQKKGDANNREKIMEATARLLVEKGYYGASIRQISQKVGIQSSTIFYYFKNKDDIVKKILDELNFAFIRELEEIVEKENLNGIDKLKRLFKSYLGQIPEKRDALQYFFSEGKHIKDKSEDIFKMVARQAIHYNDLLMSILVQIQEEYPGCFDGIDLELFSRSIYGICNWSLMWYKKDGKYSDDEIVEYYMKIFIYDKIGRG